VDREHGAFLTHERVAEEVGKVTAEQSEDEADGDLGLSQGDAAEGHDQRHQRSDQGARYEREHQAAGTDRHHEAAHGREQDRTVDRQVDHAGPFRKRLTDRGDHEGSGCGQHAGQPDGERGAVHQTAPTSSGGDVPGTGPATVVEGARRK